MRASGFDTALLGFGGGHQHHRGGAVVDARRVAGGDGAGLIEGGAQLGEAVESGAVTDVFVLGDDGVAFLPLMVTERSRR